MGMVRWFLSVRKLVNRRFHSLPEVKGKTWVSSWPSREIFKRRKGKSMFYKHIEFLLNRKNSINGVLYKKDPTIMTWEIAMSQEPSPTKTKWHSMLD
jgi:endo-1,4-beta-mannosidase